MLNNETERAGQPVQAKVLDRCPDCECTLGAPAPAVIGYLPHLVCPNCKETWYVDARLERCKDPIAHLNRR